MCSIPADCERLKIVVLFCESSLSRFEVNTRMDIKQKLKQITIEDLALEDVSIEDIEDDSPIFGETGLGLDSLDAVELVVVIQKHFGVQIKDMAKGREVFQSFNTLADFIQENMEK
jgi:acyl carrier protein